MRIRIYENHTHETGIQSCKWKWKFGMEVSVQQTNDEFNKLLWQAKTNQTVNAFQALICFDHLWSFHSVSHPSDIFPGSWVHCGGGDAAFPMSGKVCHALDAKRLQPLQGGQASGRTDDTGICRGTPLESLEVWKFVGVFPLPPHPHTHTALDILIWSLLDNAWIIHGSTNRPNQARDWPKHMPKSSKALTTSGWSLERVRSLLTSVWRNQNSASAGRCIRAKHLARLWTVPLRISGCERQDMPGLSSLEGLG